MDYPLLPFAFAELLIERVIVVGAIGGLLLVRGVGVEVGVIWVDRDLLIVLLRIGMGMLYHCGGCYYFMLFLTPSVNW